MAYRCSECNRFVSTEVQVSDIVWIGDVPDTVEGSALVTFTFSLSRVCSECGAELATKEIEKEVEITFDKDELKGDWDLT